MLLLIKHVLLVNLTKGTLKTKRRKIHSDINSKTINNCKTPSYGKDLEKLIKQLEDSNVFLINPTLTRSHSSVKWKKGLLCSIDKDEVADWIMDKSLNVL